MSSRAKERHRETLNASHYVKEARMKRQHTERFKVYDIMENGKTIEPIKRSVVRREEDMKR